MPKKAKIMENKYEQSFIDSNVTFRFDGWLQVRRDNMQCTKVMYVKNKKMLFDDGIYNSKTAIIIFLN